MSEDANLNRRFVSFTRFILMLKWQYGPGAGIPRTPVLLINKLMNHGSNADHSPKNFLKPDELAQFLNISKPTVYRLIDRRQIPFHKIGGSLRFQMKDVLKYIEGSRIEPIGIKNYECKKKEQ